MNWSSKNGSPRPWLLAWLLLACLAVAPPAAAQPPSQVGQWSTVANWPVVPVHAAHLANGKVIFYPYDDNARLWDPVTNQITTPPRAGYNTWCTGLSQLADGRLLLTGGNIAANVGLPRTSTYNPFTNSWTNLPNMNAGRWYPTNTTLYSGDLLVTGGSIDNAAGVNRVPQVWETEVGSWRHLTTAQLSVPLYSWLHQAPDGRVFLSGPNQTTRYLDTDGTGTWTVVGNRVFGSRSYGSSVMYYPGNVLVMGGGDPPTNTAEVIDLWEKQPRWRAVAPLATARRQINATILATGHVLVTGGTSGPGFNNANTPVFAAELWDPYTETWMTMASNVRHRRYHAISMLLPDGRVLSAGGDNEPNREIYSPPYLFWGPRPQVTGAPAQVTYLEEFFVPTPDAEDIAYITFIRLSSVTHAIDMDQRIDYLYSYPVESGLNVTAPIISTFAPPGYYMMFLVNTAGVPSVGRVINLR